MKRDRKTKHEIRDEICNYITDHPGISFPTIQKAFRLNTGTLRYHLQYLEGEDRIRRLECLSRKYCSSDSSVEGMMKMEGLSRSQRRIALLIKDRPGISLSEIRSASGRNGEELKYTLKRLQEKRFVWKIENGRDPKFEFITDETMASEMLTVILERFLRGDISRDTFFDLKKRIEDEFKP